jgi:hypothetical protein
MKYMILISTSLLLLACNQSTSNDEAPEGAFAIYLLQDSTITAGGAFSQPIESLALAASAFLTVNDLKSYVWSTHAFELTEETRITYEQFLLLHGRTSGVPFVVTVGNDRIYLGTFWWAHSSSMPPACAVIEAIAPLPYRIQLANGAIDKRSDSRIYDSLKTSGVLVE